MSASSRDLERELSEILRRGRKDLLCLRGASLLISGGTGYIGRWLIESFVHANEHLDLGATATVVSRAPDAFSRLCPHLAAAPCLTWIQGDVRDFELPAGNFTHAIHAATDVVAANPPLETFDVTVGGTRHFLEACRSRGARHVLLLSSGAVYGRLRSHIEPVGEDQFGALRLDQIEGAYGVGKAATEWLGTAYSKGGAMACKSARVFAQVGPHLALDKHFAVGNFITDALRGGEFLIKGDGTPLRSYMYPTDLVVWLWAILCRGAACRAYNVGSEQAISIEHLAAAVAAAADVTVPRITVLGTAPADHKPEYYVPDTRRIRDELGVALDVPLAEALRRTIDWYRTEGTGR